MDSVLTEFIAQTGAEPGLGQDILAAHGWDLESSLSAYHTLQGVPQLVVRMEDHESTPPMPKKLNRGFSSATENAGLIRRVRQELAPDLDVPQNTFTLPDLSSFPDHFRLFLHKDLIESSTMASLEASGHLNWWFKQGLCQRLWPLATSGDGNCLLHAASLGIWGFHDRLLTLRKALHALLASDTLGPSLYRRWRWETAQHNKQLGLVYSETEWQREWESLVKMASSEPRSGNTISSRRRCSLSPLAEDPYDVYEGLEEIHILALSHVLRRPVVVIADTVLLDLSGQPFAPISLGGVYLPLECPPHTCHRSPLCLAYDAAHFSPLVPMRQASRLPAAIPLVDSNHKLLPLHFAIDPGAPPEGSSQSQVAEEGSEGVAWDQDLSLSPYDQMDLLKEYLDVLDFSSESQGCPTPPGVHLSRSYETISTPSTPPSSSGTAPKGGSSKLHTVVKQVGRRLRHMTRRSNSFKDGLVGGNGSPGGSSGGGAGRANGREAGSFPLSSKSKSLEGSFTQLACNCLLVALLRTDEQPLYQEEIITNYLDAAARRFAEANGHLKMCEGSAESGGARSCRNPPQQVHQYSYDEPVIRSGKSSFYTSLPARDKPSNNFPSKSSSTFYYDKESKHSSPSSQKSN